MSHSLVPKAAISDPNVSPSSSSMKADTSIANIPTSSRNGHPVVSASGSTPSDSTVVEGVYPTATYYPPPIVHNILCPKKDEGRTEPCPYCATFRWVNPGQGNIAQGPPDYVPVYLLPSDAVEDEMPKFTHPSPKRDFGPPQSLDVNPQICLSKIAATVKSTDEVFIRKSKEEIDTLLVVAGLFSAIQTAFLIESYRQLQSDPADVVVQLLLHVSQQLANSSIPAVPTPSTFSPSTYSVRTNVFWFCGLIISLATASFGIFTKQWLREFLFHENTAQTYIRIRFFRYEGLHKWHVLSIIAALPLLLQFSMFLFFVGLVEFLLPLNPTVGVTATSFICIWMALAVVVTLAPIFSPQCPWKTTLLHRPFRWIRDYFFARYLDFDKWRFNRYRLRVSWHPRRWFAITKHRIEANFAHGRHAIRIVILMFIEFFYPHTLSTIMPSKMEEETVLKGNWDMTGLFISSYALAQDDEHLLSILGALSSDLYDLNDIILCLAGIHRIRQFHQIEAEKSIGRPVSYGPSVVPILIPLLISKIQTHANWSNVNAQSRDDSLALGLQFLLDPYNEKFIDEHVLWSLVGGLLQSSALSFSTICAFVGSWELVRATPNLPQMSQPSSEVIIKNVLNSVRKILTGYLSGCTWRPTISSWVYDGQMNEKQNPARWSDKPGVLLDVMLSVLFHADIADIEDHLDLFRQTISDFTAAARSMTEISQDVAISLDLSIRRLKYLCHKIPPLTDACTTLIKELEISLVQLYVRCKKESKKPHEIRRWQRILGVAPHWRKLLEHNNLLVAVDGNHELGSGFVLSEHL